MRRRAPTGRRAGFVNVELQLLVVVVACLACVVIVGVVQGLRADAFWRGAVGSLRTTWMALVGAGLVSALLYGPSVVDAVRGLFKKRKSRE
jgi:hypothetical protein